MQGGASGLVVWRRSAGSRPSRGAVSPQAVRRSGSGAGADDREVRGGPARALVGKLLILRLTTRGIVSSSALLGRYGEDLDQHHLMHLRLR